MLNVRYNYVGNNIGVVWHAREAGGTHADVFFAALDTTTNPPSWGPVRPVLNNAAGTDQWHPALDYDSSGNWLVTYFDRRKDTSNGRKYEMYATKLSSTGTQPPGSSDQEVTINDSSDPTKTTLVSSNVYSVGEYQDVWFSNGQWILCYPFGPDDKTYSDIYFSTVTP